MPTEQTDDAPLWAKIVGGVSRTLFVLGIVAVALGVLHYLSWTSDEILGAEETATIVIPRGSTWPEVVETLEDADLIDGDRRYYFEFWARNDGLPSQVRAGAYELEGPMELSDLAKKLRKGVPIVEIEVTIPEGYTMFHIADELDAEGLVNRRDFLEAARDDDALRESGLEAESFEGYLFPDTYRFYRGTPASHAVERLHARFEEVWDEIAEERGTSMTKIENAHGFDRHDFVTLASIVEKETGANSERAVIARVFYNRLDRDMRLQTDPTCVYGERTYRKKPTPADCKDPLNRYSTYVHEGLPPGPIANPGRKALAAVLDPSTEPEAQHYLYFVARRDGSAGHHFSKTFAEHRRAIRKYLKKED